MRGVCYKNICCLSGKWIFYKCCLLYKWYSYKIVDPSLNYPFSDEYSVRDQKEKKASKIRRNMESITV